MSNFEVSHGYSSKCKKPLFCRATYKSTCATPHCLTFEKNYAKSFQVQQEAGSILDPVTHKPTTWSSMQTTHPICPIWETNRWSNKELISGSYHNFDDIFQWFTCLEYAKSYEIFVWELPTRKQWEIAFKKAFDVEKENILDTSHRKELIEGPILNSYRSNESEIKKKSLMLCRSYKSFNMKFYTHIQSIDMKISDKHWWRKYKTKIYSFQITNRNTYSKTGAHSTIFVIGMKMFSTFPIKIFDEHGWKPLKYHICDIACQTSIHSTCDLWTRQTFYLLSGIDCDTSEELCTRHFSLWQTKEKSQNKSTPQIKRTFSHFPQGQHEKKNYGKRII